MPRSEFSQLQLQTYWPHTRSGQQPARGESSPASLGLSRFLISPPENSCPHVESLAGDNQATGYSVY